MARCRHYNFLTQMVMDMPLLMANGAFRYLDLMQDKELEMFLSYLVRFTAQKDSRHPSQPPKWWDNELKFVEGFHLGTAKLPYVKNKPMKLRSAIQSCYAAYNALSLLDLSEKLASKSDKYSFEMNMDDTVTVILNEQGKQYPIAIIPKSNLNYELYSGTAGHRVGVLMNLGLKRRIQSLPVKKNLIEYSQPVITLDDTDDEDCMIIQDASSSDSEDSELPPTPTYDAKSMLSSCGTISSSSQQSLDLNAQTSKRRARKSGIVIDLTLEEEEVERAALREKEKAEFLHNVMLMGLGSTPPAHQHLPVWSAKKKTRFSLKKFSIDQVPFLVRTGLIPRRCLCTPQDVARRLILIEKYLL